MAQFKIAQYRIIGAPSKFDLMIAFFDGKEPNRKPIILKIDRPEISTTEEFSVVINELIREDGSGESWCFKGYVSNSYPQSNFKKESVVEGHFRTTTRKGYVWNK